MTHVFYLQTYTPISYYFHITVHSRHLSLIGFLKVSPLNYGEGSFVSHLKMFRGNHITECETYFITIHKIVDWFNSLT